MAPGDQNIWIPAEAVRDVLLELGADPDWAEEREDLRVAVDIRDPWDAWRRCARHCSALWMRQPYLAAAPVASVEGWLGSAIPEAVGGSQ